MVANKPKIGYFRNVVSSDMSTNYEKFTNFVFFTVGIVQWENQNKFVQSGNEVFGTRTFTPCSEFLTRISVLEVNAR